jgi:hypothetical protein
VHIFGKLTTPICDVLTKKKTQIIIAHQKEGIDQPKKKVRLTVEDDYSFSLLKKRNIFSSHFQYSERTKATTETDNTSKESS